MTNSVCTLYELVAGEDTTDEGTYHYCPNLDLSTEICIFRRILRAGNGSALEGNSNAGG